MTTLKPRTTVVTLYQGDDFDALNQQLDTFTAKASQSRLGDLDEVSKAQQDYNDLADAAVERAVKITLQALPRKKWRDLVSEHPARPGNEDDKAEGFNRDALGDDLVPASITEGFPSMADRDEFLDALADGDWEKLLSAAIELNRGLPNDPKARLSLLPSLKSEETSSSPENDR